MKKKIRPLFYFAMLLCAVAMQMLGGYLIALTKQRTSSEFLFEMLLHQKSFYAMVPVAFYCLTGIIWLAFLCLTIVGFTMGEWYKKPLSSSLIALCCGFLLFCASLASLIICMATQNGFDLMSIFAADSSASKDGLAALDTSIFSLDLSDALGIAAVLSNLLLVLLILNTAFKFTSSLSSLAYKKVLRVFFGASIGIAAIMGFIFLQNTCYVLFCNAFEAYPRKLYDICSAAFMLGIVMLLNCLFKKNERTVVI